jgi:hypothetical protein
VPIAAERAARQTPIHATLIAQKIFILAATTQAPDGLGAVPQSLRPGSETFTMNIKTLAVGCALAALAAGAAMAQTPSTSSTSTSNSAMIGPSRPIPYSQMRAYMRASPRVRASRDWWAGANAQTGTSANASTTVNGFAAPGAPTPGLQGDTSFTPSVNGSTTSQSRTGTTAGSTLGAQTPSVSSSTPSLPGSTPGVSGSTPGSAGSLGSTAPGSSPTPGTTATPQ